jgi:glycosyltransferase involved in cell wall biosynthesis
MSISVGLLTYNRSKIAIKTIKSLLNDQFLNKIFIFDDGSCKGDFDILSNFCRQHSKITIYQNSSNQGYQSNLKRAIKFMSNLTDEFIFICESDMLLAEGWGRMVIESFDLSEDSIALSVMLHQDQLQKYRSLIFKERCLTGHDVRYPFLDANAFDDTCYIDMPDNNKSITMSHTTIIYVSNGVGSIIFRLYALKKIALFLEDMNNHLNDEDVWLHYACFKVNGYNSKSIMALDPGLALTAGGGEHGAMHLNNVRWMGSVLRRNKTTAFIMIF